MIRLILQRINELSRIQRETGLTEQEKAEQAVLRTQYLELIRGQVKSTLLHVSIVDEQGNEVTPSKLMQEKQAEMLRTADGVN